VVVILRKGSILERKREWRNDVRSRVLEKIPPELIFVNPPQNGVGNGKQVGRKGGMKGEEGRGARIHETEVDVDDRGVAWDDI
jgi:hypothetical protein